MLSSRRLNFVTGLAGSTTGVEVAPTQPWMSRSSTKTMLESIHFQQYFLTTLSMVRSGPMRTEVWTEPNLSVLGSVLCEGGLDPHLQVQGPGLNGLDLRVKPGLDLFGPARTSW